MFYWNNHSSSKSEQSLVLGPSILRRPLTFRGVLLTVDNKYVFILSNVNMGVAQQQF